jgi:hypothetical protein
VQATFGVSPGAAMSIFQPLRDGRKYRHTRRAGPLIRRQLGHAPPSQAAKVLSHGLFQLGKFPSCLKFGANRGDGLVVSPRNQATPKPAARRHKSRC